MTWQVVLTQAAERDIDAAAVWYENESPGLGREFLDAIAVSLQKIEDNPKQVPAVHRDKRRALLRRFPYGLYFPARACDCGRGRLFSRTSKSEIVEVQVIAPRHYLPLLKRAMALVGQKCELRGALQEGSCGAEPTLANVHCRVSKSNFWKQPPRKSRSIPRSNSPFRKAAVQRRVACSIVF